MSTYNLCFEQEYEKYQNFLSIFFSFSGGKLFSIFNRHVFVMYMDKALFVMMGYMCILFYLNDNFALKNNLYVTVYGINYQWFK